MVEYDEDAERDEEEESDQSSEGSTIILPGDQAPDAIGEEDIENDSLPDESAPPTSQPSSNEIVEAWLQTLPVVNIQEAPQLQANSDDVTFNNARMLQIQLNENNQWFVTVVEQN